MDEPSLRPTGERGTASAASAILDALPGAVYATDAAGVISYCNAAALALWGRAPAEGERHSGGAALFTMSGAPLARDATPLARALAEGRPQSGEMVIEQPDGTRHAVHVEATLLRDAAGAIAGATALVTDIPRHGQSLAPDAAAILARRLAAIVESSDDAILAKDLKGIITDFNQGAERLFGYRAAEVIGRPVTMLIPEDRLDEEPRILERIRAGQRIDHFETTRRRKDGTLLDISLTISPIRAPDGTIVGASKIARDITERRRAEEQQQLLLREMNHRIKNLFALSGSLISLTSRQVTTPQELADRVGARLAALARAHDLTLTHGGVDRDGASTTLHALAATILAPFAPTDDGGARRINIAGEDVVVGGSAVTSLALLMHEFATNATKYGALSTLEGRIDIRSTVAGGEVLLDWTERGVRVAEGGPADEGFGSVLVRATARGQLGGGVTRRFEPDGLTIRVTMPIARLAAI